MADPSGFARRALTLAALSAAALLAPTAPAHADETAMPVSYLEPYNLDWLAYVDPADIPPTRYAICIVDTGVAVTPDTPADDPNGPIISREAFDGGTGEPQTTDPFGLHGTRMAMAAVAPPNNWGTVGVWPYGRVISMRATVGEERFIRPRWYHNAALACVEDSGETPVAAIVWSLSCSDCRPTSDEAQRIDDALAVAHDRQITVVAAAGNTPGAAHYPADRPGVVAVAGGSGDGSLCAASAFSPDAVIGPGCPADSADPLTGESQVFADGGSSVAAAAVASLVTALRTLAPELSRARVERAVIESARVVNGRIRVDGAEAAERCGLQGVLGRARARMSAAPSSPPPAVYTNSPLLPRRYKVPIRLPSPRMRQVRVWRRGSVLRLIVRNMPARAQLEATVVTKSERQKRRAASGSLRLRLRGQVRWLDLRFIPSAGSFDQRSSRLRIHVRGVS